MHSERSGVVLRASLFPISTDYRFRSSTKISLSTLSDGFDLGESGARKNKSVNRSRRRQPSTQLPKTHLPNAHNKRKVSQRIVCGIGAMARMPRCP